MIAKAQIEYLVDHGFVVVTPEYRLCPQVPLLDGPVQDAKDAYKWCQTTLPEVLKEKNVEVDTTRIVAMGHSAGGMLALVTGLLPSPPLAILDFYGMKYLSDPSLYEPVPALAQVPDPPKDFLPDLLNAPQAISSEALDANGAPNLGDPRCAWYAQQMKRGTSVSAIVKDLAEIEQADPTFAFTKNFPPTYFVHTTSDAYVPYALSARAHGRLKDLGVTTVLVSPEGLDHGFDWHMEGGSELFGKWIEPALAWLVAHV